MSDFPLIRLVNDPANPYRLYPTATDTDTISKTDQYGDSRIRQIDIAQQLISHPSEILVVQPAVSYTADANEDLLGDTDVIAMYKLGVNPQEATLRNILNGTSCLYTSRYYQHLKDLVHR